MQRNWKVYAGLLTGLVIAGGALIAENNTHWGIKSFILFSLGIFIIICSVLYREENIIGRAVNTELGRMYLSSAIIGSLIVFVYIWVISIGTWTTWPETTNYYDLLANGFRHGQLHIQEKPDSDLLALVDPYNPDNRENIPVLWDLTLYKGEYYLYWGPAPAFLVAIAKLFYTNPVTDNVLTFIFMAGLLIFQSLLVLEIWKNYFREMPAWIILLSIPLIGLINPILYMLLEPRIYEAAVASGQFFFMGGLYFLFTAFNKSTLTKLVLAGTFFTLAIGSRTTLLLPIALLVLISLIWAIKSHRAEAVKFMIAFTLPLIIGGAGYAWYNYKRFGSFTEFGLSYQLTQTDIHTTLDETFSLSYTPPNLFKLLVNPFESIKTFPFIKATRWGGPAWFESYNPKIYDYFAEDITGILVSSPFLIFAVLAATTRQKNLNWITTSLGGSSILIFFTLLAFFYLTMRYLLDLIPALSLLACIGFWQGFHLLSSKRTARYLYTLTGTGLWAHTIVISFIICYSNNLHRIRIYNLELVQNITWTFNHIFK